MMLEKVQKAKEQFAKLQQAVDEALWEDVDKEVDDGKDCEVMMEGRVVKKSDVHNMLHFAKLVNLMDDKTRVRFFNEINSIKAGKVKFSRKIAQSYQCSIRLKSLSTDGTRWLPRLCKEGKYSTK